MQICLWCWSFWCWIKSLQDAVLYSLHLLGWILLLEMALTVEMLNIITRAIQDGVGIEELLCSWHFRSCWRGVGRRNFPATLLFTKWDIWNGDIFWLKSLYLFLPKETGLLEWKHFWLLSWPLFYSCMPSMTTHVILFLRILESSKRLWIYLCYYFECN